MHRRFWLRPEMIISVLLVFAAGVTIGFNLIIPGIVLLVVGVGGIAWAGGRFDPDGDPPGRER